MAHEKSDHVIMELVPDRKSRSGHSIRVTTPAKVLRIHDVEELHAQLEHYNRPFIRLVVHPDTPSARKWYVEKVRPALRYYCQKFGVEIPGWLKTDDYFHNLDDAEKVRLFGTTTLTKREFRPVVKATQQPADTTP